MTLASFLFNSFYEKQFLTEGQIEVLIGRTPFEEIHLAQELIHSNWMFEKVPDGYSFTKRSLVGGNKEEILVICDSEDGQLLFKGTEAELKEKWWNHLEGNSEVGGYALMSLKDYRHLHLELDFKELLKWAIRDKDNINTPTLRQLLTPELIAYIKEEKL